MTNGPILLLTGNFKGLKAGDGFHGLNGLRGQLRGWKSINRKV